MPHACQRASRCGSQLPFDDTNVLNNDGFKKVESGATLWRIPSDAVEAGGGGGGESAPQPLQELMTLPNNEGVVGAIKGTHWHPSEDGKLLSLHDNALQIWDLNAELSSGVCERSMNWQSRGYMCSLVAGLYTLCFPTHCAALHRPTTLHGTPHGPAL